MTETNEATLLYADSALSSDIKDEYTRINLVHLRDCNKIEVKRLEEHNANIAADRKARRAYAKKVFTLVYVYMAAVMLLVAASHLLGLSDTVLCTLLGASTLTVLGWLTAIICYLFPKK